MQGYLDVAGSGEGPADRTGASMQGARGAIHAESHTIAHLKPKVWSGYAFKQQPYGDGVDIQFTHLKCASGSQHIQSCAAITMVNL